MVFGDDHTSYIIDLIFICLFLASELIGVSKADATGLVELVVIKLRKLIPSPPPSPNPQ